MKRKNHPSSSSVPKRPIDRESPQRDFEKSSASKRLRQEEKQPDKENKLNGEDIQINPSSSEDIQGEMKLIEGNTCQVTEDSKNVKEKKWFDFEEDKKIVDTVLDILGDDLLNSFEIPSRDLKKLSSELKRKEKRIQERWIYKIRKWIKEDEENNTEYWRDLRPAARDKRLKIVRYFKREKAMRAESDEEEDEKEYGVEKILNKRTLDDGSVEYKVQWESTWESLDKLAGSAQLIQEFEAEHQQEDEDVELSEED